MTYTESVIEKLKTAVPKLVRQYGLDFLIVFGSIARGKGRDNSDIDIGFKSNIDFHKELQLAGELSDILNSNYIDLVNLNHASPLLRYMASREAILIYEKNKGDFSEYRTYSFKSYIETKKLRDINFKRTIDYIKQYSPIAI